MTTLEFISRRLNTMSKFVKEFKVCPSWQCGGHIVVGIIIGGRGFGKVYRLGGGYHYASDYTSYQPCQFFAD